MESGENDKQISLIEHQTLILRDSESSQQNQTGSPMCMSTYVHPVELSEGPTSQREQLADFKDYFEDTINFINSDDILQHVYDAKWDKQNRKEHYRREIEERDRVIERLKAEVQRLTWMLQSSNERGKVQLESLKEENQLLKTHLLKSNQEWQACLESVGSKHKEVLLEKDRKKLTQSNYLFI